MRHTKTGEIIDADKRWVVTSFDNNKKKKEKEVSATTRVTPDDNEGGRAVTPDASFEGKDSKLSSNFQINSEEKPSYSSKNNQPNFSIAPEEDAAYLDAVEKGDERKTAEMVSEAAKSAGMATNENGSPVDLYHGTGHFGFTIFDKLKSSIGAFFTSTKRNVAANYGPRDRYAGVRKINQGYKEDS